MDADLDTLALVLYVKIDELLIGSPERVGIAPRISDGGAGDAVRDAGAVVVHQRGPLAAPRAHAHLRHLFPYLPQQPGYNKRLRKLAPTVNWPIRQPASDTSVWCDDVWVIDSTPIECARSRETVHRSELAGWAEYAYCASHSRYF